MPHHRKKAGFVHRVTVDIPVAEFYRLKRQARAAGKSISEATYEQLETWLKSLPPDDGPPHARAA